MRLEHKMILDLCLDNDGIEIVLTEDELKRLDWSEFLWQVAYNKVDCLLADKTINNLRWYRLNEVLSHYLNNKYLYTKARNSEIYEKELPEVIKIINSVTTDYAFMKGIVSAGCFYKSIGNRQFGDLDVLIRKSDLANLKKSFRDAGYATVSEYDLNGNIIKIATEEYINRIETYTDQTHEFSKIAHQPFLHEVAVDMHFGFGRHSRDHVLDNEKLVETVLSRREKYKYNDTEYFGLSKEDFLLFACIHTYKEEIEVYRLETCNDGRLYQFAELYRILKAWHQHMDWQYIRCVVDEINIGKHVYYCLYHCSSIFDEIKPLVNDFLKDIEPEDLGFLNEYGGLDTDEIGIWDIPFIEKLFSKDKYLIVKNNISKIYR